MSELDALQASLTAEHAACFAYGVLGGVLAGTAPGGPDQGRADLVYVGHRALRDELTEVIAGLDADPVAAEAAYALPFAVTTTAACRRLAALVEERVGAVHSYAVSQTTGASRELLAEAVTSAALAARGWGTAPSPFPTAPDL